MGQLAKCNCYHHFIIVFLKRAFTGHFIVAVADYGVVPNQSRCEIIPACELLARITSIWYLSIPNQHSYVDGLILLSKYTWFCAIYVFLLLTRIQTIDIYYHVLPS